jgi:hypothetical protein
MSSKQTSPRSWLEGHRFHHIDSCLIWPFAAKSAGYGIIQVPNGRSLVASRVMCAIAHGRAPDETMEAAHSCGNPMCVNPKHLRWATSKENHLDRRIHGTDHSGEKARDAKLTVEAVEQIRARRANGESLRALGKAFGVTHSAIQFVVAEKTWVPGRKLRVSDKTEHRQRVALAQSASRNLPT